MAQYKVPQDVEADDKLIGPFSFRQFVYLLIAAGLIALAVGLFQLFPLLAIIPLPPVLLFLALALPLKKDQPMETYLAAIISYYLKPRKRVWTPGQRESTILITAPKIVEETRTRDISQEEATHRLSFLADIVDTGGYAIKGSGSSSMREDLVAEANSISDMFENYRATNLDNAISKNKAERHEEAIRGMREAIDRNENVDMSGATIQNDHGQVGATVGPVNPAAQQAQLASQPQQAQPASQLQWAPQMPQASQPTVERFTTPTVNRNSNVVVKPEPISQEKKPAISSKPSIMELANNSDFSVATIAKEANRINRKDDGEVFISLH